MKHTVQRRIHVTMILTSFCCLAVFALTATAPLEEIAVEANASVPLQTSGVSVVQQHLSAAIDQRQALLNRKIAVKFVSSEGKTVGLWSVRVKDHPEWVVFDVSANGSTSASIAEDRILEELLRNPIKRIDRPDTCTVLSLATDTLGVERANTNCVARPGFGYDPEKIALTLAQALERPSAPETIDVELPQFPGSLQAMHSAFSGTLVLLGSGRSDFSGSGLGRKANVRKAIGERLNNVVVPPGVEFSFNSVLGKSISTSQGWQMALTIFNGKDLEMAPGGGICQSSTTMFRALLQAGFPIIKRKSHSLYVHYYEKYGVGLDATVFPGQQDLVFVNDTGHPVVIQSYYEGDEAFVNIYGTPDLRRIAVEGPYFASNAPADLLGDAKKVLRKNQIAWVRRSIAAPGAPMTSEVFVSNYNAIPRALASQWPLTVEINEPMRHAAASLIATDR